MTNKQEDLEDVKFVIQRLEAMAVKILEVNDLNRVVLSYGRHDYCVDEEHVRQLHKVITGALESKVVQKYYLEQQIAKV